jgi:acetyltransferase-like isoleucine patch superfamily enzyme
MIQSICKLITTLYNGIIRAIEECFAICYKKQMAECGRNVMLKPLTSIFKGISNFHISPHVRIARYAVIYSTKANVYIGSKVGIAPYLKIITGNHSIHHIGYFIFDGNYPKDAKDDKDVIIEGDSWIGINVTILSGVTVGRGSVIAAGAVLNKSCPPYSIVGGVPARVLKYRFTIDEALEHEKKLYTESIRYTRQELEDSRKGNPFNSELSTKHLLRL